MSNYVTLVGAEEVGSAGRSMRSAADEMRAAANQIEESLSRHRAFLDDWLTRFDAVLSDRISDMGQTLR